MQLPDINLVSLCRCDHIHDHLQPADMLLRQAASGAASALRTLAATGAVGACNIQRSAQASMRDECAHPRAAGSEAAAALAPQAARSSLPQFLSDLIACRQLSK